MSDDSKNRLEPAILEACLDRLPIGAIIVDDEGIVRRFNRYEEQLSGRRRQDVIGRPFFSDVAPCTNDIELGAKFRRGIAEGHLDVDIEFSFPYPYNRVARDVRIRAFTVEGQRDHANLILIEEITGRRELERNNQTMMASLRALLGSEGDADAAAEADADAGAVTEERIVCVLADLSSYRGVAGQVAPAELFGLLDQRIRFAVDAVHRFGGHIDEIRGDSVRAYFVVGSGDTHNRAYFDALRAARAICREDEHNRYQLPFRVGVASGTVWQGTLGRREFAQRAAVGGAFTSAQRLSSLARSGEVILGAEVEERARDAIGTTELPAVPVAGLDGIWPAYRLERLDLP